MKASTGAVLILVAATAVAVGWHYKRSAAYEFTTAAGRTIRAHDATFGSTHVPKPLEVPLAEKIQTALRSRSLAPLQQPTNGMSSSGGPPGLMLWVSERDIPKLGDQFFHVQHLEIHLPDGQVLLGKSGGSGSRNPTGGLWALGSFPIVPWRERELDVRFEIDGVQQRLSYPNPAYKSGLPDWQPAPLPQTWEQGRVSVTLKSLELSWNKNVIYKGLGWELRKKWSVMLDGQPADDWFMAGASIEDAGGNHSIYGGLLGESAWKLHGSLSRSYAFPFPDGEVKWFGWVDAKMFETIKPGECAMLTVDDESRSWGISFAGLFAPGDYEIENGKIVAQSPPGTGKTLPFVKSSIDQETKRLKISIGKTVFLRHVRRDFQAGWFEVWVNEDGKPSYLGGQGSEIGGGTLWQQELWGAQGKSFKYGIAKKGEPLAFEFMVRPPAVPAGGIPQEKGASSK